MKIHGFVPARMGSSRFPGKPLYPILGRPMLEHVFLRANRYECWDSIHVATCDVEIADFANIRGFPVVMTSDQHTRCLDRVAEAVSKAITMISDDDIIVCVQGDEPMMHPDMIAATLKPLQDDRDVNCTVLAMAIGDEMQFNNPDTVKIIHDLKGDVLYTSRSPIPYCKKFDHDLGARRIYGILAFRWHFLKQFTQLPESPLELKESCDSNRILDHGYRQRIAPYPFKPSFSVDSPADIHLVEQNLIHDSLWGYY